MKSSNKNRLFEIMGRVDSSFKPRINEEVNLEGLSLSDESLKEIFKGYLEAALWTEEERLNDEASQTTNAITNDYEDEDNESDEEIRFLRIMRTNLNQKPIESFTKESIDPNSVITAYLDLKKFINDAGSVPISEALEENGEFRLGMDIWLTRNRHGSGFFDHSYDSERELTVAAQNLRGVDLYLGDDNKLHFSNAN